MAHPNPGREWNKKERLEIIGEISSKLIEASRNGKFVPAAQVFEMAERIRLAATQTAYFLENNRRQILEGFTPANSNTS